MLHNSIHVHGLAKLKSEKIEKFIDFKLQWILKRYEGINQTENLEKSINDGRKAAKIIRDYNYYGQ